MKIVCWTTFEFPTRITSGNKFEIISGVASCKHYFETFRHINGSTTSLNEHQCPKIAAKDQQLDEPKRGEAKRGTMSQGEAKSIHKILPRFGLCYLSVFICYTLSNYSTIE
jgi:hypothetical protein